MSNNKEQAQNEIKERRIKSIYRWLNPQETNEFLSGQKELDQKTSPRNDNKRTEIFPSKEEIIERAKLIQQNKLDDEELYNFSGQFGPIRLLKKEQKLEIKKVLQQSGIELPLEWQEYIDDEE